MFVIQWPEAFLVAVNWVKGTFKFDIIQLPGAACLWNGVEWWTTTLTYTLLPIILLTMLGLPVMAARCRGLNHEAKKRYRATVDKFWV